MFDPVETLKDLVRIDTTNPPGNELPALEYVRGILENEGIETTIQKSGTGRGNLLARVAARGGIQKPPLLLLSHIDVVAANPEQWRHHPFEAREENGYIYGRGTVDTKQLTVMEMAALCALQREDEAPDRDVYLLATSDEESGSHYGLQYFTGNTVTIGGRTLTGRQLLAGCDTISEGGGFPILVNGKQFYLCETGQKSVGTLAFTLKARKSGGAFFTSGDGMQRAMALVQAIGALELEKKMLPTARYFEEKLREAAGGGENWQAQLTPPMRNILRAIGQNTITATMVTGQNINQVTVTCDVRLVPGYGRDYLEAVTQPLCKTFDCECEVVTFNEGYESNCEGDLPACLEAATRETLTTCGEEAEWLPFLSMGSSDGRFLAPLGARVYGYSPVLAKDMTFDTAIGMVHGVDERIHVDSVRFGCDVLTKAVLRTVGITTK